MSGEIEDLSDELNTELELLREIFVKELHVENCRLDRRTVEVS